MELIMKTDLEKELPQVIEYNHEELKAQLTEKLEKYNNLVVTEDEIKAAKSDRANLNKLKTALENKRKEVKAKCLEPYEVFANQINEVIALVEEPIKSIDSQIKEFDKVKKEKKVAEIETVYTDGIGVYKDLIPLEKIWNPKWLNVTYKITDIGLEIEGVATKADEDLQVISALETEFEQAVKDKYFETLDLSNALAENQRLKELRAKQEELKKAKAEQEANRKKNMKIVQEQNKQKQVAIHTESEKVPQTAPQKQQTTQPQPLQVLDFRVWVTQEQKMQLRQYLLDNKIKFGRVQ